MIHTRWQNARAPYLAFNNGITFKYGLRAHNLHNIIQNYFLCITVSIQKFFPFRYTVGYICYTSSTRLSDIVLFWIFECYTQFISYYT